MTRVLIISLVAIAVGAGAASAQTQVKKEPIKQTSPIDAKAMYKNYCSACHGPEGKGNGPAASALKTAPADLTKISARNGGTFPDTKVMRYIQGLDEVPAHGSRDMPMWGDLFGSLNRETVDLRIRNLTDYVKSLQQ